jgi:hypothetical protein
MPSDLPIVTPDPAPSRGQAERYGSFYYLGIAGLVVLVGLLTWFGVGLWNLRGVLREIYVLHDPARDEADRIQAALDLARDPHATQRQRWDVALRRGLPPLGRYLVAESLTAGIVREDPRGYTLAVARSRGWPGWLRVLAVRPLAYAADDDQAIPPEVVAELADDPDPVLRLWVAFVVRALGQGQGSAQAGSATGRGVEEAAGGTGDDAELAGLLLAALRESGPARDAQLDRATQWLRDHHPGAAQVWAGWEVRDGELRRRPAR